MGGTGHFFLSSAPRKPARPAGGNGGGFPRDPGGVPPGEGRGRGGGVPGVGAMPTPGAGLAKAAVLLAQRDGTDKVLKAGRYAARLGALRAQRMGLTARRARALERALSLSRKAVRWGKFLGKAHRAAVIFEQRGSRPALDVALGVMENLALSVFYFLDQFQFLFKAGIARDARLRRRLEVAGACAELVSYAAAAALAALELQRLKEEEATLRERLVGSARRKAPPEELSELRRRLARTRLQRALVSLSLVQTLTDTLLTLNDIRQADAGLGDPHLLAWCGLVSAFLGLLKMWRKL